MNKGIGMDGFQEIMPMGDDDALIAADDLNDSLSPESLLNEQMKDILIFDGLDLPPAEVASLVMVSPMEIGEGGGDLSLESEGGAKLDDPVRLYLKEMGSVSLLTREGEVEIAKRIEEGEKEVLHSLLEVPITLKEIMNLTERLEQERLAPQNGLDDFDEDDPLELPTQKSRVLKLVQKLRTQDERIRQWQKEAVALPRKDETRLLMEQKTAKERRKMADNLKSLRLERHYLEEVLNRLRLYGRMLRDC
ncbi:MAG TPA: sigma-70 factor domain-containing protein, partial [Desulfobaccales bacterium]